MHRKITFTKYFGTYCFCSGAKMVAGSWIENRIDFRPNRMSGEIVAVDPATIFRSIRLHSINHKLPPSSRFDAPAHTFHMSNFVGRAVEKCKSKHHATSIFVPGAKHTSTACNQSEIEGVRLYYLCRPMSTGLDMCTHVSVLCVIVSKYLKLHFIFDFPTLQLLLVVKRNFGWPHSQAARHSVAANYDECPMSNMGAFDHFGFESFEF